MSMLDITEEGKRVVERRHAEYTEFHITWRWLQDSLEGGQRYRDADYGYQRYTVTWQVQDQETGQSIDQYRNTQIARRNLIRHPQEYPVGPGQGGAGDYLGEGGASTGDEYEFRRSLTPVPCFVAEGIEQHLARIYAREVKREPPPGPLGVRLQEWWQNVDGAGTSIDEWMQETIAPLFLVLGQLDLAFDRPVADEAGEPVSQADVAAQGLDRCVASYILPENLTDWELEPNKDYEWCVVREWRGQDAFYRKWTETDWTLYTAKGEKVKGPQGEGKHPYGGVPIFRAFDVRKARCDNVGQSKYEVVAELQRCYYNVDSELTLANSLAAHPLLSGPEEYCSGQSIRVGPGNVLPMKRDQNGQYAAWKYVSPPSEAADKLRAKLQDIRDAADRALCLTKPAGAKGTTGHTVAQSGISKMLDQATGNDLLTKIARSLQRLERDMAEMALIVLNGGPLPEGVMEELKLSYPTKFDLFTAGDFAALIGEFQALLGGLEGQLPVVARHMYGTYERLMLSGLDDQEYEDMDQEMDTFITAKQERSAQAGEAVTQFPFPQLAPGGPSTD